MRKQTKLVAVLSAAALLAVGASMTSFAGWEKDEDGIWHYYDSDDEMVEDEWRKDGSKWFYLDEDGNMATDTWVDDEYYVGSDGAMLKNAWIKTTADEDVSDPEDDGDNWYYFGSNGKKVEDDSKKINGKTYYFNEDGEMRYGWYEDNGDVFYLGGEDEGWRAESQWLWLEKSGLDEDDLDDDDNLEVVLGCTEDDDCDDEGWYYFQSSGKVYTGANKKKINGRYYMFNNHGQMLYEWINGAKVTKGSNAQLDGENPNATPSDVYYMNVVEEGWRADGWYQIDGAEDLGANNDTDWYYFKDGKAKKADKTKPADNSGLTDDGAPVYVAKIKVEGKYFAFNEKGQMQTGLQYIDGDTYYFDSNGYMKTGKVSNVEEENDSFTYYFQTKNGGNGKGVTGEKSGYLYWKGKRLEAEDDYRIYLVDNKYYLVNKQGKIQKSESKKYDLELADKEDVQFKFSGNTIKDLSSDLLEFVDVPKIELYDNVISAAGIDEAE